MTRNGTMGHAFLPLGDNPARSRSCSLGTPIYKICPTIVPDAVKQLEAEVGGQDHDIAVLPGKVFDILKRKSSLCQFLRAFCIRCQAPDVP
jgi:hypothetical protein